MTDCTIGEVHFGSTPCAVLDLGPANEAMATPIDLGLGMPLLALADWLFDFPSATWGSSGRRAAASGS